MKTSAARAALWLGLFALSVVWGTQFLVIRLGQQTVPPLLTACLRFAVFAAVAEAVVLVTRARAPRELRAIWRLTFGLAQAAAMSLLYVSEKHVPSSVAAVVFGTTPFFVSLLAHAFVPGERLRGRVLASAALGFLGVCLLLVGGATSTAEIAAAGVVAALGAAFASAVNKVVGKRLALRAPVSVLLRDMATVVAAGTGLGWWLFERDAPVRWTADAVFAALYLGLVASAAASSLYLVLLRRLPVTSMAYLQFVTALIGVVTGVLLGGESFSARHAAGAALILAGLAAIASDRTSALGEDECA